MVQVGVAQVKAHFSELLARVRGGEEIVVTDHGRPVARLIPVSTDRQLASEEHLEELERAGIVRIGASRLPRGFWEAELPNDPEATVLRALLDERASGR
ncbi:MAG: type II toxin-antitoxin system Phd/YefM family antitoxin [Solirubrobacteraceae bacterium]